MVRGEAFTGKEKKTQFRNHNRVVNPAEEGEITGAGE